MSKFFKKVSSFALLVLVSCAASYGTYVYLQKKDRDQNYSTYDVYSYSKSFDQENLHLTSGTGAYPDFRQAAENSVNAVVHIKSTVAPSQVENMLPQQIDPFEYFFGFGDRGGRRQQKPQVGYGSGVIISKDGYIITNNHVIDKATELDVTLNDNKKYKAKLIGADPTTDIALIKIEGADFPYLSFGNSDDLKVGEWVLAIGNPFDLTSTVTAGIVSAKGRGGIGRGGNEGMTVQSFIQTDAAINPGNSGGALVNTSGQLVGINTAIYSQTGNFAGYGFAVPISIAGKVVADLKEYGTVQRAVLGIVIQDVGMVEELSPEKVKDVKSKEGVYVENFAERSPAKEAGIEAGDIITKINSIKVKNVGELQDQVNRYRPGDKVQVTVVRKNVEKNYTVTLKNSLGSTTVVKNTDALAVIGAAFREVSADQKRQYGISYGVEVAGVDNNGKFKKEGIMKGFVILKVNNQPIKSVKELEGIIESVSKSADKGLFLSGFYPDGKTRFYAIDLSE